jgi:tetratricopeptide (TPR) repeat protein
MALQLDPLNPEAHYNLGCAYFNAKIEPNEIINELEKALSINPKRDKVAGKRLQDSDRSIAHYVLGVMYSGKNEHIKASQEFKKAIAIDSSNVYAHRGLVNIYLKHKDYIKALREFETILQLDPEDKKLKTIIEDIKKIINN